MKTTGRVAVRLLKRLRHAVVVNTAEYTPEHQAEEDSAMSAVFMKLCERTASWAEKFELEEEDDVDHSISQARHGRVSKYG